MYRHIAQRSIVLVLSLLTALTVLAQQAPTSRVLPFAWIPTTLPPATTQLVKIKLYDVPTGAPSEIFEEEQMVDVDESGFISFNFGAASDGLRPEYFATGTSRYVDVAYFGTSVLVNGRLALYA